MWLVEKARRQETHGRLWNPETKTEFRHINGSSSGLITFAFSGPGGYQEVPARMVFPELTSEERLRLGVPDGTVAIVWRVQNWPDSRRQEIKEALLTYKHVLGWAYPGAGVYLVQFGLKGELENA